MILRFRGDDRKFLGQTLDGLREDTKKTVDLRLDSEDWKDVVDVLECNLEDAVKKYVEALESRGVFNTEFLSPLFSDAKHGGFQIQKYTAGDGFFGWHSDAHASSSSGIRFLTYLWYLNDVERGGETEFIDGTIVCPRAGDLVLFPADWSLLHRGKMPVSSDKYVCTGWLYKGLGT